MVQLRFTWQSNRCEEKCNDIAIVLQGQQLLLFAPKANAENICRVWEQEKEKKEKTVSNRKSNHFFFRNAVLAAKLIRPKRQNYRTVLPHARKNLCFTAIKCMLQAHRHVMCVLKQSHLASSITVLCAAYPHTLPLGHADTKLCPCLQLFQTRVI